jgi:hypothetical protein
VGHDFESLTGKALDGTTTLGQQTGDDRARASACGIGWEVFPMLMFSQDELCYDISRFQLIVPERSQSASFEKHTRAIDIRGLITDGGEY